MKITFRITAPLLLGCALLVSSLVSAEEMLTCGGDSGHSPAVRKIKATVDAPGIAIKTGSEAEQDQWTYNITNTGNVKLTNVQVTDERFIKISCQQDVLDVGESMGCTASEPSEIAETTNMGCAVADHVVYNEVGVTVTTKGDCVAAMH
ncbi:MAG: conserved repeat domain-containing protein [Candidatus Electronema aureum]|uniref:Conserved repeat domain-containing protein n=1 Tax=Candidatus Electronema aureum TaxID=2005002 RepID=A0A521FYJ4_9BACT|nr:MAG: conserved repeat domain-containing protein [Candidatus Electronema aureum]